MTNRKFQQIVTEAIDKFPSLASRIDKATAIITEHFADRPAQIITATVNGRITWNVRSQSTKEIYTVNAESLTCTCPDSQSGHTCKHLLAVRLLKQIMADPAQDRAPINTVCRVCTADDYRILGYAAFDS